MRARELPVFTRALAAMLEAGLPLNEALMALEAQTEWTAFRSVIREVRISVESGQRLSVAMGQFPGVFDTIYVSFLKTGEISGRLAETLARVAEFLESNAELKQRVRSAMTYPLIVAWIAIILASAIIIWIVPAFETIYEDLGGALPRPTRLLLSISRFVRDNVLLMVGAILVLSVGLRLARRTLWGRYLCDKISLKLPVFGGLVLKLAICRFAESLSQMLKNGVPILSAIDLAAQTSNNGVLIRSLSEARKAVQEGEQLHTSLRKHRWCPALLVQMVAAGERTGQIDDMLQKAAKFYRTEVLIALKGMTSAIEPLLIVFLGVLIGGIVVCLFIPIFKLGELVSM